MGWWSSVASCGVCVALLSSHCGLPCRRAHNAVTSILVFSSSLSVVEEKPKAPPVKRWKPQDGNQTELEIAALFGLLVAERQRIDRLEEASVSPPGSPRSPRSPRSPESTSPGLSPGHAPGSPASPTQEPHRETGETGDKAKKKKKKKKKERDESPRKSKKQLMREAEEQKKIDAKEKEKLMVQNDISSYFFAPSASQVFDTF